RTYSSSSGLPASIEKPPPPKATICRSGFSIRRCSPRAGRAPLYSGPKFAVGRPPACTGSEDLAVEESRDQDKPAADLGSDQSDHVPAERRVRLPKLVLGVFAQAVVGVARDGAEEEDRHRRRREQVYDRAPAAQLDEGRDQQQGEAVEERRAV